MADDLPMPAMQPLSDEHSAQLAAQRAWVAGHFTDPALYDETANKLRVVATILENGWVKAEDTVKLQCLGVTLGDALAEAVGLDWVTFSQDDEQWPGLRYKDTSLFIHPVTMISKRVEAGEAVDVIELFRRIAYQIEELKDQVD